MLMTNKRLNDTRKKTKYEKETMKGLQRRSVVAVRKEQLRSDKWDGEAQNC